MSVLIDDTFADAWRVGACIPVAITAADDVLSDAIIVVDLASNFVRVDIVGIVWAVVDTGVAFDAMLFFVSCIIASLMTILHC